MSVTLKGNPITLNGQFPQVGATAAAFRLVAADLSEQGGNAVNRIHQGSSQVLSVVNDISCALREQSQTSNDIAMNVEKIAQVAAENAGIAHETAQATNQMHQMTDSLRKMVSRFQI